jgi:hypothetical protein
VGVHALAWKPDNGIGLPVNGVVTRGLRYLLTVAPDHLQYPSERRCGAGGKCAAEMRRVGRQYGRTDALQSTATGPVLLPLQQNSANTLNFTTSAPSQHLKFTYNAECVLAANLPGVLLATSINVLGVASSDPDNLCNAIDSTGKTWAGAARQFVLTVPAAGTHTATVYGQLGSGLGTWLSFAPSPDANLSSLTIVMPTVSATHRENVSRLKDFRRIATRYDKLARNFLASVVLAAAIIWWT